MRSGKQSREELRIPGREDQNSTLRYHTRLDFLPSQEVVRTSDGHDHDRAYNEGHARSWSNGGPHDRMVDEMGTLIEWSIVATA